MAHTGKPSTWEGQAGGSGVEGQPRLYSEFEFEASLDCMRPCLKNKNKQTDTKQQQQQNERKKNKKEKKKLQMNTKKTLSGIEFK